MILAIMLLFASLWVLLYSPRSLDSLFAIEESNYVILSHREVYAIEQNHLSGLGTMPGVAEIRVSFESGTPEFKNIVDVLSNFSFHRPITSFFRSELNPRVGNSTDDLLVWFIFYEYEVERLFFRSINGLNLMTNNQIYSIRNNEITLLIEQLLKIMTENFVE